MLTFLTSLYALALAACTLCILIFKNVKGRHLVFLLAFLLLQAAGFVFEWFMLHPTSPGKSLWLGLLMWTSLLVAPCLWLFAREITEGEAPSLRLLPAGHFIVIAAGMLLVFPLLRTAHWGPDYANPEDIIGAGQRLFIHGAMLACVVIFLFQAAFYIKQSLAVLIRYRDGAKALFSNIEPKSLNALRLLILVVCVRWLVSLLRTLHCIILGKDTSLVIFFVLIEVLVILWALIIVVRQTTIFSVDDRKLISDIMVESSPDLTEGQARYSRSSLDLPTRERVARKLKDALVHQHLYRDNLLSLRELCRLVNENPHYVSQVINQDFETSFYDLINSYRIEYAKGALLRTPEKTILDIALDAGFNSKSTFNAAFRRHTQTTPSEYRRTQLVTA